MATGRLTCCSSPPAPRMASARTLMPRCTPRPLASGRDAMGGCAAVRGVVPERRCEQRPCGSSAVQDPVHAACGRALAAPAAAHLERLAQAAQRGGRGGHAAQQHHPRLLVGSERLVLVPLATLPGHLALERHGPPCWPAGTPWHSLSRLWRQPTGRGGSRRRPATELHERLLSTQHSRWAGCKRCQVGQGGGDDMHRGRGGGAALVSDRSWPLAAAAAAAAAAAVPCRCGSER